METLTPDQQHVWTCATQHKKPKDLSFDVALKRCKFYTTPNGCNNGLECPNIHITDKKLPDFCKAALAHGYALDYTTFPFIEELNLEGFNKEVPLELCKFQTRCKYGPGQCYYVHIPQGYTRERVREEAEKQGFQCMF